MRDETHSHLLLGLDTLGFLKGFRGKGSGATDREILSVSGASERVSE